MPMNLSISFIVALGVGACIRYGIDGNWFTAIGVGVVILFSRSLSLGECGKNIICVAWSVKWMKNIDVSRPLATDRTDDSARTVLAQPCCYDSARTVNGSSA
jgi:hypothetical protein